LQPDAILRLRGQCGWDDLHLVGLKGDVRHLMGLEDDVRHLMVLKGKSIILLTLIRNSPNQLYSKQRVALLCRG